MKYLKVTSLVALFAMLVVSFLSCSKDSNNLNGDEDTSLIRLFNELSTPSQKFSVNANTYTTITGANGTIVNFSPLSFKEVTGHIVVGGQIDVYLIEMYRPGQMIMNNVTTTTTDHNLLRSGGSVWIKAFQNGRELYAGVYSIAFKQPTPSSDPMALYYGEQVSMPSGSNMVQWINQPSNEVASTIKLDQGQESANYYLFDSCTNFNWVNCDYFYNAPNPKTNVVVNMPDASFNATNTQVFVIFPSINMVSAIGAYDAASNSFKLGWEGYYLPVGVSIKLCILSSKNEQHYLQIIDGLTVSDGMSVNASPQQTSVADMQTALSAL